MTAVEWLVWGTMILGDLIFLVGITMSAWANPTTSDELDRTTQRSILIGIVGAALFFGALIIGIVVGFPSLK